MFALSIALDDLGLVDDCEMGPDVIVGALAGAEAGAQLQGWLSLLDPARLTEAQVLEVGAALERQRRHDAAFEFALLARLETLPVAIPDSVDPDGDRCSELTGPERWAARIRSKRTDLYAAVTAQSATTVSRNSAAALQLAADGPLAATGAALAAGLVSEIRARVIAEQLAEIAPADAAAIEAAVLPDADLLSRGRLERELAGRKAALNPVSEREQHLEARALRCVSRPQPLPAGMSFLEVLGPAEDVHLLHTALTSIAGTTQDAARQAARGTGDGRLADMEGIDAHRFDALINLAAGALAHNDHPERHGRRPAIGITIALSTLLGLDDHPADLAGYGPITAEAARRAASDPTATLQRLITRPDGLVIDAAYTSYRPPQALCDTVIARDRTCTFPRCTRAALRCDIDHQEPWPVGSTCLENNHCLCRGHHNLKTAGIIRPEYDPDTGDTIWTLPGGRTIRRPAERYRQPGPSDAPPPSSVRPRALRAIADALGSGGAASNPGANPDSKAGASPGRLTPIEATSTDDDPPPF